MGRVIVMTLRYDFWNGLIFFELFKLYFHLGLITTPHVLYVHMTYVYSLFLMFHSSHDHTAKRSHHRIMIFSTSGNLLFYGRTPTLIFPFFLLYRTTPILTINVLVIRTDLKEDPTRTRRMAERQIPTVRRRTMFGPD